MALSSAMASALVGLTASANRITPRRRSSQLTATLVRPSASPALDTLTTVPSTTPRTPVPGSLTKSLTPEMLRPRSRAAATIAAATGCSEAASTAAARASSASASSPASASTACTLMWPVVTVPVLSSTTVSMLPTVSSTCGALIRTPSCAPRPVPTRIAVGVARPSAQGQAMISTATAAVKAAATECPVSSQPARVNAEITRTAGTKTAETRSARRWMDAFPVCASATIRAIRASCVSDPTLLARNRIRP